jgi:hypothetical protein
MGFASLQHTRSEGPLHAGFACPLRSALRVWLPSRRFTPFEPLPVLFHTGGAHGITPSKRSPLARYPNVSARKHPHTVSLDVSPAAEAAGRPAGPRFLGVGPGQSPLRPSTFLACRPPEAPLGFTPLGPASASLAWAFAPAPLTRFYGSEPEDPFPFAPQSINRLPLGLVHREHRCQPRTRQPF